MMSFPLISFIRRSSTTTTTKSLKKTSFGNLTTTSRSLSFTNNKQSSFVEVAKARSILALQENNEKCIECLNNSPDSKFILFHRKGIRPLLSTQNNQNSLMYLNRDQLPKDLDLTKSVLLDIDSENAPIFATSVDSSIKSQLDMESSSFMDLRLALFTVGDPEILTRGWSMLKWHEKTNFCSNCGSAELNRNVAGCRISCGNCSAVYYPATSPVGIVLITNPAHDRVLLVHLDRHPQAMYSCIAGFVDAGETLEDCVKREAAEEAGVQVENIRYHSSQHWPFPRGSLMMGCTAVATEESFLAGPDPLAGEVKSAKWFTAQELDLALCNKLDSFFVPPTGAIANKLMKLWLKQYHQRTFP